MQKNIIFSERDFLKQAKKEGITHISTGVAILRDNKILMVKRAVNDFLGGNYELPGGGVDEGETISEGAIREVKEETGLDVANILTTIPGFDYSTDKKPKVRQVNFLAEVNPWNVTLDPKEHDEFIWIDKNSFRNINMSDSMRKCLADVFLFIDRKNK